MEQAMIKNAAAEDRIDELERQLQSLKQKEGASQRKDFGWLTVTWKDDKNVQAVTLRARSDDSILMLSV